jgi:hypothetical protein
LRIEPHFPRYGVRDKGFLACFAVVALFELLGFLSILHYLVGATELAFIDFWILYLDCFGLKGLSEVKP